MTTTVNTSNDSNKENLPEQNPIQELISKSEETIITSYEVTKSLEDSPQAQPEIDRLYWKIMRQWLLLGVKEILKGVQWLVVGGGKSLFVVAGLPSVWGLYQYNNEVMQSQQKAVENYIGTVKALIFDELHANGKVPDIEYEDIRLFIRAQAGTTLTQLDDCRYQNKLISFLRDAKIGFLPRNLNSDKLLTKRNQDYTTSLWGIDLTEANLNNAKLEKAQFQYALLADAQLKRTELSDSNLHEAYLVNAKLNGVNLFKADLGKARLMNADLSKSYVEDKTLNILFISLPYYNPFNPKTANLQKANLQGANLQGANLQEANLQGANLTNADLMDANLRGATNANANLSGAKLCRTIHFNGKIAEPKCTRR